MGWLKEGIWLGRAGSPCGGRRVFISTASVCSTQMSAMRTFQSPWAARYQRMTLTLALPGQVRLKVRSIPMRDAAPCLNALEQEI